MPDQQASALTPEQWESRDYRQVARDLDGWAEQGGADRSDDRTEYVATLGLNSTGSVVVMNRAHDRVLVPPPARLALAALTLAEQPFGFTHADVAALRRAGEGVQDEDLAAALRGLRARLEALLPPTIV